MKLISNEMMKIFKKASTYIMLGLLTIIIIGSGGLIKYMDSIEEPPQNQPTVEENGVSIETGAVTANQDWKQELSNQNKMNEEEIKAMDPETDKSYIDYLKKDIAINEYRLENDIAPNYETNVWSFLNDMASSIPAIAIITITIAAGIVANEFSTGTIKLLLIRPVSRAKILLSKYASVVLFSIIVLLFTFILSFLVGAILFGFGDVGPYLTYSDGQVLERTQIGYAFFKFMLSSIGLFMLTTMAFMISAAFRNSSLAIGISMFLLLMGSSLTMMLAYKFEWAKYIIFANIDLLTYFENGPLIEGMTLSFSIIVLIVYFALFHLVAFLFFTKRDVAA